MKFVRALALSALAFLLTAPLARADQSSIVQPTVGPHSLTDMMSNYTNPAFRALLSNSSGTAAPANGPGNVPMSWQQWLNTTSNTMEIYDGAQWASLYSVNATTHAATWIGNLGQASTLANGVTGSGAVVLQTSPTINIRQTTTTLSPQLSPTFTLTAPPWATVGTDFYSGAIFNLGGLPINAMDTSNITVGKASMIFALTAAYEEPNCGSNPATYSTVNPLTGKTGSSCPAGFLHGAVGGFARTGNTSASAVGLFGVGLIRDTAGTGSARTADLVAWGGNTIASNSQYTVPPTKTGFNHFTIYGWEFDINAMYLPDSACGSPPCVPTGTVRGISVFSGSEVKPTGGAGVYGIEVASFKQVGSGSAAAETASFQSVTWDAGLTFGINNGVAININSMGLGTGQVGSGCSPCGARNIGSQPIVFNSYDINQGLHTVQMATNQDGMFTFNSPIVQGPAQTECGSRKNIDVSVANTDIPITIYPPSARYVINAMRITNPSVSMTAATFGLFSATLGGGAAIVSGGTALSPLTTNAADAGGSVFQPTVNFSGTVSWDLSSVQFRVGTAQAGSGTRTVDAYLYCIAFQ